MVDYARRRVLIELGDYLVRGTVTLPADEHYGRLSDLLNSRERDFISLTDATIQGPANEGTKHYPFTAVRREQILFASEIDETDSV